MPLSPSAVVQVAREQLFPAWKREQERLDRIDKWYRWENDKITIPRAATPEMRALVELAKTPWLRLVVNAASQAMHVDGYRSPDAARNAETPWMVWQRNDMDRRQTAVHKAMLAYGYSFVVVLPGVDWRDQPLAVMRGKSPRRMQALYANPAEDDWPQFAIEVSGGGPGAKHMVQILDEEADYFLSCDTSGGDFEYIETRSHDVGVTPVVRYANDLDLEGRLDGEVEPFIPVAGRINKTSFDRLMTQHYNSWKVRTVAGMAEPDNEESANQKKLKLRQDDVLVAEDPDTKFGSLPETPLDGFIRAWESDIESLAAVSQTPTHALTGKLINLSADALASARAEFEQKIGERKRSAGSYHDQSLRLGAHIMGDDQAAADFEAHATWQDTSIRSLAQAVDALGKAAQMLGVPPEALWTRIPGVTKLDVDEWRAMARRDRAVGMAASLRQQAQAARQDPDVMALAGRGNAAAG